LEALGEHADIGAVLATVIRDKKHTDANRLLALRKSVAILDKDMPRELLSLLEALEDGPVLAEAVRQSARFPEMNPGPRLVQRYQSASPPLRAAILEALG
jgi:hypothetical protein